MSRFVKTLRSEPECITLILQTEDGFYHYVDGRYLYPFLCPSNASYEVMSFPYDNEKNEVISWEEEFVKHYENFEQMVPDLCVMTEALEGFISNGKGYFDEED